MRLLSLGSRGELSLTKDFIKDAPRYAILSHTWGADEDEVNFDDLEKGSGKSKAGYAKIQFCGKQARKDGLQYFWVDTCCIDKRNSTELMEAINSMFRWYRDAVKCYVYLSDVSTRKRDNDGQNRRLWEPAFRVSRWFTRGWTLQELLAPASVEFFSRDEQLLGNKNMLEDLIHEITDIPIAAIRGAPLSQFPVDEQLRWADGRNTTRIEDKAYCLLGIFEIFMPFMYGEGENAFKRLKDEVDTRSGKKKSAVVRLGARQTTPAPLAPLTHVHWMVTRPTNPMFTGREDLLQKLAEIVRRAVMGPPNQKQCRIVISGMGGQGKSEICLQLAHRLRQSFWGVFWLDVSTVDLAESGFLDIASQLRIPAQTLEEACRGLANIQRPWLLVLDNADDPSVDYQYYFPTSSSGVVMLTSRNDECQQYATEELVALGGLSDGEARELLLRAAQVPPSHLKSLEDDAQVVASLLRSHPLALIQAGSYVSRGHCTLAGYPRVFEQQRKRLLAFRPAQAQSRYRDVYATFEASTNILQSSPTEVTRDVLQLLRVLSMCGPGRLPMPLFEAGWKGAQTVSPSTASDEDADRLTPWYVSHLPPFIQVAGDMWDSFRLVEAIHLLKAFSLVSTDTYDGFSSVSMHPLVHAWARDRLKPVEQHESWLSTGCLVAISRNDHGFWQIYRQRLQPHLQALMSWDMGRMFASEPVMETTSVIVQCGWLMYDMRDDAKLFVLMNSLLTHLNLDWLTVDRRWLPVYSLIARNLVNYGKVKEAVSLLEQVVRIEEQTLAEDHPSRLASQHVLAGAYEANGQVKEAISLLEYVVRIREQTVAEDDPSQLASQHELAGAYKANGQVKEAVSLLEHVVRIEEQTLSEDDSSRLASQHELARAYEAIGQVEKAVILLEHVVRVEEQTLAEDHPSRLASQQSLANIYRVNGQVKEAMSLLEHVVRIRKQTLAEDHPSRLASQHELAKAYQSNGQVEKAVSLQEYVVRIREQTLAEDHPSRLVSQQSLAVLYQANRQVKEAVSMLEHVVKIREQTLAEDHLHRLGSQHKLARAYQSNGQVEKAVSLLEHVVRIREQMLAEDHPSRLASQHSLARAYKADGQIKEAVSLLEHVVRIREQTVAEDDPSRLASQHSLARAYEADGQVKEAVSLLEHVVRIEEHTLAEDHPSRLASQRELARAYEANGQVKEAVSLLEQVVRMREQTLAEDHPSRLASQHELARAYEANGQIKEAISLLEHVVRIEEHTLAEDDPSRLTSQHGLAAVYEANGQVKEAVSLLEHVVRIEEQTLAEDHPHRLTSQHVLAIMLWNLDRRNVSLQMMKHVVEMRKQVLNKYHPDRMTSESWLEFFENSNATGHYSIKLMKGV